MQDNQGSYQLSVFRDEITNVVVFENDEPNTALLKNFTITNGYAGGNSENNSGGGIRVTNNASPMLQYLVVNNNLPKVVVVEYSLKVEQVQLLDM